MDTRVVKATRFGAAAGLALLLGVGFMPGCGHTTVAESPRSARSEPEGPPDRRRVTKTVVQELSVCALEARASAPWRTKPEEMPTYWVEFDMEATEEGDVDLVTLTHSTLEDAGVERCMAKALRGMSLSLEEMKRDLEEQGPIPLPWSVAGAPLGADARGLMGTTMPMPGLGGLIVLIPVVIVGYGLYIVLSSRLRTKAKDIDVPRAKRICPQAVHDELDAQKEVLCNSGYAANCAGNWDSVKNRNRLDQIECSKILKSVAQRQACVEMMHRIQRECYDNVTDAGHQESIDKQEQGFSLCEKLRLINCAEGHPMAHL